MDISTASIDLGSLDFINSFGKMHPLEGLPAAIRSVGGSNQEYLRRVAWEIGEAQPAELYQPHTNLVGLGMVHPTQGFAYWNIRQDWIEQTARQQAGNWDGARLILRLYDVSYILFNGFNAHRIQDQPLSGLKGHCFFHLPGPGTWQLAEVGFLLRNGIFVPAARSEVVSFAHDAPSRHHSSEALLVLNGKIEPIANVWDAENELRERRRPRLRQPLRIAALAFSCRTCGHNGQLADFVTELARGQHAHGHEVHVLVPACPALTESREEDGVFYHPLPDVTGNNPIELARSFARAAEQHLAELPPFDLIHMHEWMTCLGGWVAHRPTVLSLSSIEATRRNGREPDELSRQIEQLELQAARTAACVLTPAALRERVVSEMALDSSRVHAFPLEGRLANEWEMPIDPGKVKMEYGMGPLDRVVLFVGPLEYATGIDILVEALPVSLRRWNNLKLAVVGNGPMQGQLERRAWELGIAGSVRFLGHISGQPLTKLVRSSLALILPSRYRIAMDDAVVDLARKGGRPVVTTQGGPAHLVRHEENGLITYDNPGSMVWALDRILGDPGHAERMGQNGRRHEHGSLQWADVAHHYLQSCVNWFPELTVKRL